MLNLLRNVTNALFSPMTLSPTMQMHFFPLGAPLGLKKSYLEVVSRCLIQNTVVNSWKLKITSLHSHCSDVGRIFTLAMFSKDFAVSSHYVFVLPSLSCSRLGTWSAVQDQPVRCAPFPNQLESLTAGREVAACPLKDARFLFVWLGCKINIFI